MARPACQGRVLVKDGEWNQLLEGVYRRNVVSFITKEQAIWHRGQRLGSGFFGVPKGELGSAGFDPQTASQRLIANAIPSNELQNTLVDAIEGLPPFTQRIGAELLEDEAFLLVSRGPELQLLPRRAACELVAAIRAVAPAGA